jgi:multidrug efflux system outer membrane protein
MRSALVLLAAAALSGCMVGPDYERPHLDLPKSAFESTLLNKQQEQALAHWWTRYQDPILNNLIVQAVGANLNIALQVQKVRQARAELGYQNAQFYPTIEGQAQGMRKYVSEAQGGGTPMQPKRQNYFSIAATLNYELDFWGALRRADQQARAQLLSSVYTKDSVRLQTIADVVTNYMSLRDLQHKIKVTKETIQTRIKGVKLNRQRYKYGAIDKLTLYQSQSLLDSARAQLSPLQQNATKVRTSLAILTGKTPREIMNLAHLPKVSFKEETLPQALPVVLPSALVNRRPDIRAAEASLIAANANVGVAKAQFFPTFNLSAMIGTQALHVEDLFGAGSEAQQFGGAIMAPILEFGRIKSQYESAKAQKAQAVISYKQTVRQAFKDIRNALNEVKYSRQRLKAVQREVRSYKKTVDLAKLRYQVGRTNFFDVLDAQRQLFSSQLNLADAIRDRYTAIADLYKALGGGWDEDEDVLSPTTQEMADKYMPVKDGSGAANAKDSTDKKSETK